MTMKKKNLALTRQLSRATIFKTNENTSSYISNEIAGRVCRLKNVFHLIILIGIVVIIPSCNDDDDAGGFDNFQPIITEINGSQDVELETTVQYSVLARSGSSYEWTSTSGTIELIENSSGFIAGNIIEVTFDEIVSSATISVTETAVNGNTTSQDLQVSISNSRPIATASLVGPGSYSDGLEDSVKVTFDFPVSEPTISSSGLSSNLSNTTMTSLSGSDTEYFTIVTFDATGTDSDIEFTISGATRSLGGMTMENTTLDAEVDNTRPNATISFSRTRIKDGDKLDLSVAFDEEVTATDSTISINIAGNGVDIDTLFHLNESGVWQTTSYEFPEGIGDQILTLTLSGNATDLARNDLNTNPASVPLIADNTAPILSAGSAVDAGAYASLSITTNEDGFISYLILTRGEDAPTDEDFLQNDSASMMTPSVFDVTLDPGTYDVYLLSTDEAGNTSDVSGPFTFTMN